MSDDTVFDLDAARARRLEESGAPMEFQFAGQRFTMPAPSEWPLSLTETLAQGELTVAFRHLLGDEQFDRFLDCTPRPTLGDLETLLKATSDRATGGPGN